MPQCDPPSLTDTRVLMIPAWWPSIEQPLAGVFNQTYAQAMSQAGATVGVIFPDLVHPRHLRHGRNSPPVFPRVSQEQDGPVSIWRVRGVHTAFRQPAIQMHRFLRWTHRAYRHCEHQLGRPHLIHAFCAVPAGFAAARLAAELDIPFLITEHTGPFADVMRPPRQAAFATQAINACGAWVAVSRHQAAQMRDCGIERETLVIPNPVADAFAYTAPPPIEIEGRRRCRAIFVGRMEKAKGVEELLTVAIRMAREHPAESSRAVMEWHFVGDGPLASDVKTRLKVNLPPDQYCLHGRLDAAGVAQQVQKSHMLVLPSHGETFGLAAAEALCCGRPVVTTRHTACEELIDDSNGMLCNMSDAESLHKAVLQLADRCTSLDHAAISQTARQQFTTSAVAARYAELYHQLLSQ